MKRLVILRPEPGATESMKRARELGLDPLALPLFTVEPVAWEVPEAGGFDGLLLTSANALRHGGEGLRALRGLKAYCVGEATAHAAREAGFDIAATGTSCVARLLDSIEPEQRLLHLCGEHRTCTANAKQPIEQICVYRSAELPQPENIALAEGAVVAIHSTRAGERLAQLAGQCELDRSSIALAAISAGAGEAAGEGWMMVEAAEEPTDSSLLALAKGLCDKVAQQ